jgi:hypothetical protein
MEQASLESVVGECSSWVLNEQWQFMVEEPLWLAAGT